MIVIVVEAVVIVVNNMGKEIWFQGILTGIHCETGRQYCVICLLQKIIYCLIFLKKKSYFDAAYFQYWCFWKDFICFLGGNLAKEQEDTLKR